MLGRILNIYGQYFQNTDASKIIYMWPYSYRTPQVTYVYMNTAIYVNTCFVTRQKCEVFITRKIYVHCWIQRRVDS
jgi:hypothetical protein